MSSWESSIQRTFRETCIHLLSFQRWIILCLVILYICSGIYAVSSNEIGILQRFGKVLDDKVQPGIHFALPWPIDRVTKVPIRIVNRMLIDDFYSINTNRNSTARFFTDMTGLDSYCVTGDNNLVNVMCVMQYTITNPFDYIFRVKSPNVMLRSMAANTVIHCLARMPIDEALTRGKQGIAYYIKLELQKRLDEAQSGLTLSFVELSDITPPIRVQQIFSDVVKADIDRVKMINEAEAYRNEKIPAAQANANRILQEAEAYKREVVLKAEGDTDRFTSLLEQGHNKKAAVREMIYIETMQEVLKKVAKKHIVMRDRTGKAPAHLKLYCPP